MVYMYIMSQLYDTQHTKLHTQTDRLIDKARNSSLLY